MRKKIVAILEEVRPALQSHTGDVEFVDFDEGTGVVSVRLKGACKNCPLSTLTLKMGIEALLCQRLDEVSEVISVE